MIKSVSFFFCVLREREREFCLNSTNCELRMTRDDDVDEKEKFFVYNKKKTRRMECVIQSKNKFVYIDYYIVWYCADSLTHARTRSPICFSSN